MALNFITVPIQDLGSGIDQLSAENAIPEGFSEDLLNVDATADGYLRKRSGYQAKAGGIPVRVASAEQDGDQLTFTLDGSIDLSGLRSSPIVVYGRTSASTSGDFSTTDGARYYSGFSPQIRKTLAAASASTLSLPESEHQLGTEFLQLGLARSDSTINRSNELLVPDGVTVEQASGDVTIDYTNGSSSTIDVFAYYLSKAAVSGSIYVSAATAGATSHSINAATHGLNNFNIAALVYADDGTDFVQISREGFARSLWRIDRRISC